METIERLAVVHGAVRRTGLREMCLELTVGRRVGLVGVSGAGKSTLARVMAGLLRPDRGHLAVNGRPVRKWPRPRWFHAQVQYLHQAPGAAFDPLRTLRAQMEAAARTALNPKPWDVWWDAVGLEPDLAERYPHTLSAGQRHRAGLARVLAVQPRFLLVDEPTQGLDPQASRDILRMLDDLSGLGLLWIAHSLSEVLGRTERMVLMEGGTQRAEGPRSQWAQGPGPRGAEAWLAAARRWEGRP